MILLIDLWNELNKETKTYEDKIYHYTSPKGLISILDTSSIWLGDFRFLNDKNELTYATEIIREKIKAKEEKIRPFISKRILDICDKPIEFMLNFLVNDLAPDKNIADVGCGTRYYIFSTSLLKDSLNMWNYYTKSKDKSGYCIEFDFFKLLEIFKPRNGAGKFDFIRTFGKVIYDEEVQSKLIDGFINELIEYKYSEINDKFLRLETMIIYYMIYFKASSFRGEEEARILVALPMNGDYQNKHAKFTIKHGFISPALEIVGDELIRSISSITVGPYNSEELSVLGLKEYFSCKDINDIDIMASKNTVRF